MLSAELGVSREWRWSSVFLRARVERSKGLVYPEQARDQSTAMRYERKEGKGLRDQRFDSLSEGSETSKKEVHVSD